LLGRDRDLVETLLRERSAGLKRTRVAMRYRALDASATEDPVSVVEEEPAPAGTCVDCGGEIPAGRLRAVPLAIRCAGCQLERESQTL
jgi:hypothetical protein